MRNIDRSLRYSDTPIERIVLVGGVSEIKRRLKNGMSINEANSVTGHTMLHIACVRNILDVCEYLVSFDGLQLNLEDRDGRTPSDLSALCNNKKISDVLIKYAADRNILPHPRIEFSPNVDVNYSLSSGAQNPFNNT